MPACAYETTRVQPRSTDCGSSGLVCPAGCGQKGWSCVCQLLSFNQQENAVMVTIGLEDMSLFRLLAASLRFTLIRLAFTLNPMQRTSTRYC